MEMTALLRISTPLALAVASGCALATGDFQHAGRHKKIPVTDCGPVLGAWDPKFQSFAFRGIPYAMPPIGPRRWQRSEMLSVGGGCWSGTLDTRLRTDEFMDSQCCAQNPSMQMNGTAWDGVEDCLTIDVRSPMDDSKGLRPVLVTIHGGSLMSGVPDIPYGLRTEGFVVVGVRYRLNVLGFLAAFELTEHDVLKVSGNYGFSDQVTALQWVQRNVKAFGGDPDRVTIIGCSSGGSSIWNLLAMPATHGLFSRAIPLSAASRNNMTLEQASRQNAIFVEHVCGHNATGAYACLKEASLQRVMAGFMKLSASVGFDHPFDFELPSPAEYQAGVCIVDGVVVRMDLQKALSSRKAHRHVPVLSGSCSQEGATQWLNSASTTSDYLHVVEGFVRNLTSATWPGNAVSRILQLYPPTSQEFYGTPKAAMDAMIADIRVVCGTIFNAERLVNGCLLNSSAEFVDLWLYYSDMRALGSEEVTHCSTMDVLCDVDCSSCSAAKKAFYNQMISVHSEFIKTGSPPAETLRRFADIPSYRKGEYILNSITGSISASQSRLKDRCEFWRDTNILQQYAWDELKAALEVVVSI